MHHYYAIHHHYHRHNHHIIIISMIIIMIAINMFKVIIIIIILVIIIIIITATTNIIVIITTFFIVISSIIIAVFINIVETLHRVTLFRNDNAKLNVHTLTKLTALGLAQRRISYVPNLIQKNSNKRFFSFALDSAHATFKLGLRVQILKP